MSPFRLATAFAVSVSFTSAAFAQTEQRSIKGATVAVYNLAGRVRAIAGAGDAVVVEITRSGSDAAKLKIETGLIGTRETLRIVYPSDRVIYPDLRRSRTSIHVRADGTFGGSTDDRYDRVDIRSDGPGLEAHADLVVHIPRGQKIELFLGVGRAEVVNVEGELLVDVASAEVDIAGVKGNLTLDTGSGRVSVRDVTGDVNIDSGSGGLTVDKVKGSSLRLDSGSGGVQASDIDVKDFNVDVGSGGLRVYRLTASDINVDTGSGGATLELLSVFEKLTVDTGSGGVTVRAPAALSAEVDVETGSGGFQTDFEITTRRVSRNHIEGRIGAGKAQIRIEAGSGTIRLLKS
jgi:lia operon protein LiaG